MSEKEIKAYLITRDALRRLKRAALPLHHRQHAGVIVPMQSEQELRSR